jgi:hypothetical protein
MGADAPRGGGEERAMGIDDLVNQGKEFLEQNKDKIGDVLKSEQAEGVSDKALDAAADFVKKVAPDSIDQHVDGVRDNIDKAVGNE